MGAIDGVGKRFTAPAFREEQHEAMLNYVDTPIFDL